MDWMEYQLSSVSHIRFTYSNRYPLLKVRKRASSFLLHNHSCFTIFESKEKYLLKHRC